MKAETPTATAIPGDARHAALDALGKILRRHLALDDALHVDGMEERDRGFARLLLATTLRRLGQIDALIAHCLEHPLPAKAVMVQDILRLGTAQLLFLDVAAHAAVDTAVRMTRDTGQTAHVKLVNAVLRRLVREGPELSAGQDIAKLNTPGWLWDSWTAAYGEQVCRAIAIAHLTEAPLDISVTGEAHSWAERLGAESLPTGTMRRPAGGAISQVPGYDEGAWWVQDAAAALPVRLLGDVRGKRIADLCAAPGGKTAQLAAAGAHVVALDRSAKRLDRLQTNLARLRLTAEVAVADATLWHPGPLLDGVLLDAPCSATGTLRRHPDAAWLKRPEDVVKLTATQNRLLAAAVEMVAPGGLIVYCTCSLQPEEGIGQVEHLLAAGAPVRRRPIAPSEIGGLAELITPAGDLRSLPCHLGEKGGMDGFFAARLERS